MPLLVEARLARGVMGPEILVAKRIDKALGRKGRFGSDRCHRHDLCTPTETRNVLLDVQKHERVFGDRAFADPKSSATTFARPPSLFHDAH